MNNNSLGATAQARQPATHERSHSPVSSPIGECQAHEQSAEYWLGKCVGMIEALRLTHTAEQLAEMGIV